MRFVFEDLRGLGSRLMTRRVGLCPGQQPPRSLAHRFEALDHLVVANFAGLAVGVGRHHLLGRQQAAGRATDCRSARPSP